MSCRLYRLVLGWRDLEALVALAATTYASQLHPPLAAASAAAVASVTATAAAVAVVVMIVGKLPLSLVAVVLQ